jgi:hypothetical protein
MELIGNKIQAKFYVDPKTHVPDRKSSRKLNKEYDFSSVDSSQISLQYNYN